MDNTGHTHEHDCGNEHAEPRTDGVGEIIADVTDPSQLPQPNSPEEAMAQARVWISSSADKRGEGWNALALLADTLTQDVVDSLRDGTMAAVFKDATTWLGADSPMVAGPIMAMEVYARGSVRRDAAKDLRALTEDREEIAKVLREAGAKQSEDLAPTMRKLAALCHQEAQAWGSGDDATGKELRARQHEVAASELAEALPIVGKTFVEEGITNQTRTIGRLLLGYLSVETGRDYQRAVLGDTRGRSRL